ncbi:MAG: hypothetical protein AB7W47_08500 [Calditrichaceae bacterium]
MYRKITSVLLVFAFVLIAGCAAHTHKVGQGGLTGDVVEGRQWYILFGLVPLNTVDTRQMVGDETNYTIRTESSALDVIMNIFTGYITVTSRTVTVTK